MASLEDNGGHNLEFGQGGCAVTEGKDGDIMAEFPSRLYNSSRFLCDVTAST